MFCSNNVYIEAIDDPFYLVSLFSHGNALGFYNTTYIYSYVCNRSK